MCLMDGCIYDFGKYTSCLNSKKFSSFQREMPKGRNPLVRSKTGYCPEADSAGQRIPARGKGITEGGVVDVHHRPSNPNLSSSVKAQFKQSAILAFSVTH